MSGSGLAGYLRSRVPCIGICVQVSPVLCSVLVWCHVLPYPFRCRHVMYSVLVWCHVYPVSVFRCRHVLSSVLVWCHVSHIRICARVSPREVFSIGLVSRICSVTACCVSICRCQVSVWAGSLRCGHAEARCLVLNHFM